MKKLFFILIFAVTTNVMALPDNPLSISKPDDYKVSDAHVTSFIFDQIDANKEKPGDINYIFEQYKLASRQHWIQSKTNKDYEATDDKLFADFLNEAYQQTKSEDDKKELEDHLVTIKNVYKVDYKPMPIKNQFATILSGRRGYVLNGIAYDMNDRRVVTGTEFDKPILAKKTSNDPTEKKPATEKTPAVKKKAVITIGSLSEPEFLPDPSPFARCVWDKNNPRAVVYGPGCNADGSCLCRGHVICERNGQQKRRLATCSEKYCTDETPSECSAELGFGSQIPQK